MNWELKSLAIDFQEWGEFKGRYAGKITFQNGNKDAFTFTLSPEETVKYMEVIAEKVGSSASELGQKVLESLKLLPSSGQPIIQINAKDEARL